MHHCIYANSNWVSDYAEQCEITEHALIEHVPQFSVKVFQNFQISLFHIQSLLDNLILTGSLSQNWRDAHVSPFIKWSPHEHW